ncbi:hypothetical protein CF328_g7077 [Tilletia controversa]|nr:hypothetical protein CF328_g7077 [Tilletia controversa]
MAIQGTIYQRLLPVDKHQSPLNMFIYHPEQQAALHGGNGMPDAWIPALQNELRLFNPLAAAFRSLAEVHADVPSATLELQYEGPANEVAALRGNRPQKPKIDLHTLLFPHGTAFEINPGWTLRKIARMLLLTESRFQNFWRVGNLYMLDIVCRLEENRLRFITDSTAAAADQNLPPPHEIAQLDVNDNDADRHQHAALPSSFVGSRANRAEHVADALALSRVYGRPHGMLTVTTNPDWPEIKTVLRRGQSATSVPQITCRVFSSRLHKLMRKFKALFSKIAYLIQVIEFQKRGLPHAHIVFATSYRSLALMQWCLLKFPGSISHDYEN